VASGVGFYHVAAAIYRDEAMVTQRNIKSDDAHRMASRLSELTGESLTTVVTKALRSELDREQRLRDQAALKVRLLALANQIKANMPADVTSDLGWLCDDKTGLPK
jgi:antitoxin VapB